MANQVGGEIDRNVAVACNITVTLERPPNLQPGLPAALETENATATSVERHARLSHMTYIPAKLGLAPGARLVGVPRKPVKDQRVAVPVGGLRLRPARQ